MYVSSMVELLECGLLARQLIYGWIKRSKWLGFQSLMYNQPEKGPFVCGEKMRHVTCDLWPNGAKPYSFCQSNSTNIIVCFFNGLIIPDGLRLQTLCSPIPLRPYLDHFGFFTSEFRWLYRNISWGKKIERFLQILTGPRSDSR